MADAVFSFALEGEGSGADDQADALERLRDKITEGTAGLKAMGASLRAMKGTLSEGTAAFKQLKEQIEAQKASLAGAHQDYAKLGGDFVQLANHQNTLRDRARAAAAALRDQENEAKRAAAEQAKAMKSAFAEQVKAMQASAAKQAAVLGAVAAAALAVAAAIGVATIALIKFGIASADARRSQLLQLEGMTKIRNWFGLAAGSASDMQAAIDKVSASSALSKDAIGGLGQELYSSGLRGAAWKDALDGIAIAQSAGGDSAAAFYKAHIAGAGRSSAAVKRFTDDIRARFGGVAKAQMLSLTVQSQKLQESFQQLFSGLKLDGFLSALHDITDLFSQNTSSGRALKTIVEGLFQPMLDFVAGNGIIVKRFFQGLVIGALLLTIAILKVRNYLRSAFGDSEILKGLDLQKAAVYAGAAAIGALVGALAFLGIVLLVAFAPMIQITAVLAGFAYGIYRAYKAVTSIDWAGAGKSLIDGLVNGIKGGARWVIDAISNLADKAMKTLKSKLGIASPSKVFAKFGNFTAQGFAQGVDDGSGDVEAAVGGMGGGAIAAAPASGGIRGSLGRSGATQTVNITFQIDGANKEPQDIVSAIERAFPNLLEKIMIQLGAEVPA